MLKKHVHIIFLISSIFIATLFSADEHTLQLPAIEEYQLNNGMRVLLSPNYDYPTVFCHLYINSGILDDPEYQGGLASDMFWEMFDGTEKYPTRIQIRETIRELGDDGGRFDIRRIDDIECEIGSYFLKGDIKPALELYADIIQNPSFSMKGRFWEKIISRIIPKKIFYNKWGLSRVHLQDLFINKKEKLHPKFYNNINKKDLHNWHKTHIQPSKTTLMITGDVNFLYAKKTINDYFGNWESTTEISDRPKYKINLNETSGVKMRFVNMKDLPDAEIRFILKSASINDDWYFSSELANSVFFSGNLGRLTTIHESFDKYGKLKQKTTKSSPFNSIRIEGNIKYSNLSAFYDLIISEFNKLSNSTISEEELSSAKTIRLNQIKSNLNNPKDFTNLIQKQYNINGYSLQKIETSFVEMNNVSLDDINNAASRIYDPNNFILLIMGNQDSCTTFLDRFEDIEYYEQTEELR